MASLFAVLDGIKAYGISVFLFSLSLLLIASLSLLNKKRCNMEINSTFYFITFVVLLVLSSLSVGYTAYKYFDLDYISDVSEKYNFSYKTLEYRLPSKNKDMNIYFNSWYKTSYITEFDNSLEGKIKIEVKYYEAFYDLVAKNEAGNVYVSLVFDSRDLISIYLDNLKENKIYNEKELGRYLVKIYVNEKDAERLVIHN